MQRRLRSIVGTCAFVLACISAEAGTKLVEETLPASSDSWIQDEKGQSRDENLGSLDRLAIGGRWDGTKMRGLIEFDLSVISADATVERADLSLYHLMNRVEADHVNTIGVQRVLRAWTEGEVTWNAAQAANPWSLPGLEDLGVDRDGELLSSADFSAATPVDQYVDFEVTRAVAGAVDGTAPMHGFLLSGLEAGPESDRYFSVFASREYASLLPPVLHVSYSLPVFLRGDTNSDSARDLSDAVAILGYLFDGDSEPPCLKSADTNDSGDVDISDALYLLGYLFLGTSSVPEPALECGVDPTPDTLGCAAYDPCP